MFVAVYEEGSFTLAAMRENATQSGVSQHIRNLEDRMGVQLFARGRKIEATPAGAAYYLRCLQVLQAHAHARRTLDQFAEGLAGSVTVGLMPAMTRRQLSAAYRRFSEAHPNVAVRVIEAFSGLLTEKVRNGEADFAIVPRSPTPVMGVQAQVFVQAQEMLISRRDQGLVHGQPVRLADVENLSLIVPGPGNSRRAMLELYFSEHDVHVARRLEFDAMIGTLDLVATTDWMTVQPCTLMAGDMDDAASVFSVNPIDAPAILTDFMLISPTRQPMSAAALAFLDVLREVTEAHIGVPIRPRDALQA